MLLALDRATKSRRQSGKEVGEAMAAERGARALARDAGIMAGGAPRRAASERRRNCDRGAMDTARAGMREDAGRERAR